MDIESVKIAQEFGAYVSSRRGARLLRERLTGMIQDGTLAQAVLDFDGVKSISNSFSDELIAVWVAQHGREWFKDHVRVLNLSNADRHDIQLLVARRERGPDAATV